MVSTHKRTGDDGARTCCTKRILSMIAILALAAVLGILAAAMVQMQHVSANDDPQNSIYRTEQRDEFAGASLEDATLDIDYVWAASLTSENISDTTGTRLGYVSGADDRDEVGSLQPSQFTYDGEDYTVQALYYQQTPEGVHRLVLEADRPLPAQLILHIGSDQFFGCEFVVLGSETNTNVWTITRDLGWAAGRTTYAALFEPRTHQVQPVVECLAASAEPGSAE